MHIQDALLAAACAVLMCGSSDAAGVRGLRKRRNRTPEPTTAAPTMAPTAAPTAAPSAAPTAAPTSVGGIPDGAIVVKGVPSAQFPGMNPTNTVTPAGVSTIMAGNFLTYVDLPDAIPPPPDSGPVAGGQYLAFIKSGEYATYALDVKRPGQYSVTYWLNGDPPAPSVARIHLSLSGACSGPEYALLDINDFDPGQYVTHMPYPAMDPVLLPQGPVQVTLCFDDVTALNMGQMELTPA